MDTVELSARTTALVIIDLQKGVTGRQLAPHAADVPASAKHLAQRWRAAGGLVVLVRVAFSSGYVDAPGQKVDQPPQRPGQAAAAEWSELVPGLADPGDLIITKRQWGGFHGTELDLQLRRRAIADIVLGGVATNFGVESTARQAWEAGYGVVLTEDATSSMTAEMHEFAVREVMPRIACVRASKDIVLVPP